jgi:hypothetical protein
MKKWYGAVIFVLAMLVVLPASAQSPCGGVCQAYYPCDYPCDVCEGDPGLWEDGHCWGEMRSTTCGEIGQCGWTPPPDCVPDWTYDQAWAYQGAIPELQYDPRCDWVYQNGEWTYVCDNANPWKCTVYDVYRFVRHQQNCPDKPPSETFCLRDNGGSQQTVGWYPGYWPDQCCWDSNRYGCTTYFPQCPNF